MQTLLALLTLAALGGTAMLFLRTRREETRAAPPSSPYRSCAPAVVPHFHIDRHPRRQG